MTSLYCKRDNFCLNFEFKGQNVDSNLIYLDWKTIFWGIIFIIYLMSLYYCLNQGWRQVGMGAGAHSSKGAPPSVTKNFQYFFWALKGTIKYVTSDSFQCLAFDSYERNFFKNFLFIKLQIVTFSLLNPCFSIFSQEKPKFAKCHQKSLVFFELGEGHKTHPYHCVPL